MRRWWSISLIVVAGVISIALLACAAGLWWLDSASGRSTVLRMATDAAKGAGLSITLTGVDGSLLDELTIASVTIDDADGRWLKGRNLKLVWHPWQLLHGRLHIGEASARSIALSRPPHLPAGEKTTGGGALPSLPFRVDLDRLSVERFALGDAVLGLAMAARIDAQAVVAEGAGKLGLEIDRLDAPGNIAVNANFDVARDALGLDLHVEEPAGGLIAGLAGIEGQPPVRIDLDGEGPLSQWRGRLRAAIDDVPWVTLNAAIDGKKNRTVTLDGHIGMQPFEHDLPADLASLIGPDIGLAGKAVIDPERLRVEALKVDSAAASLAASGIYEFDVGGWNGEAHLLRLAPEVAAQFGFEIVHPDLILEARSSGGRMGATLRIAADRFTAQGASVDALRASVEAGQARTAALWTVTVAGEGQVTALPGEPSEASAKFLGPASVSGRATLGPSAATLEEFRAYLGPATLSAKGDYRDEKADGALSLEIADLAGLIPSVTSSAPVSARLATAMHYAAVQGLSFDGLTLDLPGGQIIGEVRLDAAFAKIDASVETAGLDIAPLAKLFGQPVAGHLTMATSLAGALADPRVTVHADLQDASFGGNALPPAEVRANITTVVSAPQGYAALTTYPPQGAIAVSTRLELIKNDSLNLQNITVTGPGLSGGGHLRLALDRMLATGQISLTASDLAPAMAVAGLSGGGSAKLQMSLSATNAVQQADLTGSLASLVIAQENRELARIGRASLSAKGALAGNSPITAKLSANGISAGGASIEQVILNARGTADQINFDLRASAPAYQKLNLALAGNLQTKGNVRTIRLTRGSGSVRDEPFTIRSGMTATIAPDVYRLRGFTLSGRNLGQVSADGALNKGRIDGKVTARGLPLELLNDGEGESGFLGEIDLTATIAGTLERPKGQATLTARNVAAAGDRAGGKAGMTMKLTADDTAAALQMTVTGLSNVPLTAQARIARSPNGLGFDANASLSGRLAWRGAVGEITKFAPLVGQQISGNLTADLTLSGTLGRPGIAGSIVMSDGSVEDYVTGLALRFPRLEIVGDNRRLELQPFEASDSSGGKLSGRASVELDPTVGFPFRAELTLANARVANRDDIRATLSGAITAEGSLAKATIRGDLRSERVEVDLDTGLPPSVVTLDAVEIPADGQQGAAKEKVTDRDAEKSSPGAEFLLDIKLHMPGQVFVRGHGLDSEWEGDIAVAGSAANPRVTGQLRSRRGQIDFLEKLFKLQPSVIDLAPTAGGGVDVLLNIKATATAKDLTVTVTVSGPATNPAIELSSTPALPQDEILSRLLFDKNRASLSPVEALQLANALSTLRGGGPNFMAKLRRTLGVDVLRLDSGSGETAPSLEAGKYVTDRIYVGVKQGVDPGSSAVSVEVDVFDNVSVGSEIRQDGGNRVGLKYKWDY